MAALCEAVEQAECVYGKIDMSIYVRFVGCTCDLADEISFWIEVVFQIRMYAWK